MSNLSEGERLQYEKEIHWYRNRMMYDYSEGIKELFQKEIDRLEKLLGLTT